VRVTCLGDREVANGVAHDANGGAIPGIVAEAAIVGMGSTHPRMIGSKQTLSRQGLPKGTITWSPGASVLPESGPLVLGPTCRNPFPGGWATRGYSIALGALASSHLDQGFPMPAPSSKLSIPGPCLPLTTVDRTRHRIDP
jgi:hypothetical protein